MLATRTAKRSSSWEPPFRKSSTDMSNFTVPVEWSRLVLLCSTLLVCIVGGFVLWEAVENRDSVVLKLATQRSVRDGEIVPTGKIHGKRVSEAFDIVELLYPLELKYVNASDTVTQDPLDLTPLKGEQFKWNEQFVFLGPENIPIPEQWISTQTLERVSLISACSDSAVLCSALKSLALRSMLEAPFIKNTKIPKIIHQSWKRAYAADPRVNRSVTSFKVMNPEFIHLYWEDKDVEAFFFHLFPKLVTLYSMAAPKVIRFDLFRYLALYSFGGVWSDTDTICLKPIDEWINLPVGSSPQQTYLIPRSQRKVVSTVGEVQMMVALELDYIFMDEMFPGRPSETLEEGFGYPHPASFVQWTFAAAPGTAIMKEVSLKAVRNMVYFMSLSGESRAWLQNSTHQDLAILKLTGPGMFSKVVHKHLNLRTGMHWRELSGLQQEFTAGDDLHVFTVTGFSAGHDMPMGYGAIDDPRALVMHLFAGSWK